MRILGDVGLVRDEDDGVALGMQSVEEGHDLVAGLGVEVAGGLVGQDDGGLLTSARAMATRWRWPPESSLGLWFMRDSRPTLVSDFLGALDACGGGRAVVDEGSSTLCSEVARASRLKVWKTNPISLLRMRASSSSSSSLTSWPLSQYLPLDGVSRQPMRFISVDLPEPDGPMMATYSL